MPFSHFIFQVLLDGQHNVFQRVQPWSKSAPASLPTSGDQLKCGGSAAAVNMFLLQEKPTENTGRRTITVVRPAHMTEQVLMLLIFVLCSTCIMLNSSGQGGCPCETELDPCDSIQLYAATSPLCSSEQPHPCHHEECHQQQQKPWLFIKAKSEFPNCCAQLG